MQPALTLCQAAQAIRQGHLTPHKLLADCLRRIDTLDGQIQAWVSVDHVGALEQADRLEREMAAGKIRSPLHGIPVGIKDIVDVAGFPTRAASPLTDPRPAPLDATVVSRLRDAGAIILGKTVTTQFACFDPPLTVNPWNLAHTPGGSSSGSAAAVALGMCLGAIASQTGGSITRPASYCGVAGCKPTFGRVSRAGVLPVSFHLDHVGVIARTAADCATMLAAINGVDPRDAASAPRDPFVWPADRTSQAPPRLGVIEAFFFDQADGEIAALTRAAIDTLRSAGATIVPLELPAGFDKVHAMHRRIMVAEAAEFHRRAFGAPRAGYAPGMSALLEEGFAVSTGEYQEALKYQRGFQNAMARTLFGVDALATPATPAAAPGRETTGDPRFNSPWSYAHVPAVSFPITLTSSGLPIALQLVGPKWSEARLFEVAQWCEEK